MANVPGSILTNPAQTADIGAFYIFVTAMRNRGYTMARAKARGLGLLQDMPSAEQAYAIPIGPIALGKIVEYKDGAVRPGAMKPQLTKLGGECRKRGIEPLRLMEGDRTAARIPIVAPNVEARGRSERLMEDQMRARALENGENVLLQPTYDGKAYYATDHFEDPVGAINATNSNLITGSLTPDRLGDAKVRFRTWKAENGDPIYAGFEPEFMLEVPPALEKVAQKICEREHVAEGNAALENVEKGTRYFVNNFLTNTRAWYLHVANAGMAPTFRVVHREMQRWDQGPDSALFQASKAIEIYADEWTDYRMTAWELSLKSTGV